MTRSWWVRAHRYAGLYLAFFLVVAGITGSILPFADDLDAWLNPAVRVRPVADGTAALDALDLRERALAIMPQARIDGLVLDQDISLGFKFWLSPRTNPSTGLPSVLKANTLTLDPYTGGEMARAMEQPERLWPVTRQNLVPLLKAVHYRLALPGSTGVWLFGLAAVIWTLDCFVGAYLTLPRTGGQQSRSPRNLRGETRAAWWIRWKRSWRVNWGASNRRVTFDLHRSGGLWIWFALLVLAWSAVGLNLRREVFEPVMELLLPVVKSPAEALPLLSKPLPDPGINWREARAIGRHLMIERAQEAGFSVEHEAWLIYDAERGMYFYGARTSRDLPGRRSESYVVFDARTGQYIAQAQPTGMAAGNTVSQWLFALHRAQVWGTSYRIIVSLMGLACALLSISGIRLWAWKRRASLKT